MSNLNQLLDLEAIRAERARRSLREFIRQAWPIIEPGTPYLDNWHTHAICDWLEAITRGECRRLIINVPPRHMKSIAVAIMWPVWEWINAPATRWMFASFAEKLSIDSSLKRREIIRSDWYQRHWGDRYALAKDQDAKTEYKNDHQGSMFSTSIGGTTTGKGGNRIVVDDPHSAVQAKSDEVRQSQNDFFDTSLYTRQNDKRKDAVVVIMQRLHDKDLTGHLLKRDPGGWEHLCLPAECSERTVISTPSAKYVREAGSILWPAREGPKEIAELKVTLGSLGFAGQYQQRPSPAGGGKFQKKWFRYWRTPESSPETYELPTRNGSLFVRIADCDRFAVIDPAGTDKKDACYTVIQVWDVTPEDDMVLVDQWRQQVETPEVEDAAVTVCRRYDVAYLGVETDGIGLGVIQHIARRFGSVVGIKCRGSKEARCEIAQIRMAAGRIYFPAVAPWLADFEAELELFPRSENKDQVDALSHAAIRVQQTRGAVTTAVDDAAEADGAKRDAARDAEDLKSAADEAAEARREEYRLADPDDWDDEE